MSLETLIAPIKWMDELLLDTHRWVAEKIENTTFFSGKTRSDISLTLTTLYAFAYGTIALGSTYANPEGNTLPTISAQVITTLSCVGVGLVTHDLFYSTIRDYEDKSSGSRNILCYYSEKLQKATRFLTGSVGVGLAIYLTNAFQDGNCDFGYVIAKAIIPLGLASSMYIKDEDTKIEQKEPFYKRAYGWVKEHLPKIPKLKPATSQYTALEEALQ